LRSERAIMSFAAAQGLDKDAFTNAYRSERVQNKLLQADRLREAFKIDGVPMIVVGGRTVTSLAIASQDMPAASEAEMQDHLLRQLDALVARMLAPAK
jgi:thiol:disulfide interchange protein DsbA